MKTLIINGSPMGKQGNTQEMIFELTKGMTNLCKELILKDIKTDFDFDFAMHGAERIVFAFPMYIHGVPGFTLEYLNRLSMGYDTKEIIFIVQYGFPESIHSKHLEEYLNHLSFYHKLNVRQIIMCPGLGGLKNAPEKYYKKQRSLLNRAGNELNSGCVLDKTLLQLRGVENIKGINKLWYQCSEKIGIQDMFWNQIMKSNDCYDKRYDKAFLQTICLERFNE